MEPEAILECVRDHDLSVAAILDTHGHADHIAGNAALKRAFPRAPLIIGAGDTIMLSDAYANLSAVFGLPEVRRVRSSSQLGVAQVRVEFEPDADYYRARQLVGERVNQVERDLPPGTDAPLVSSLTGRLNEILFDRG